MPFVLTCNEINEKACVHHFHDKAISFILPILMFPSNKSFLDSLRDISIESLEMIEYIIFISK